MYPTAIISISSGQIRVRLSLRGRRMQMGISTRSTGMCWSLRCEIIPRRSSLGAWILTMQVPSTFPYEQRHPLGSAAHRPWLLPPGQRVVFQVLVQESLSSSSCYQLHLCFPPLSSLPGLANRWFDWSSPIWGLACLLRKFILETRCWKPVEP